MHRKWIGSLTAVALCASLGCELEDGGGGNGGGGPELTVTLPSDSLLDGWIRDEGNFQRTGSQVIVGDVVVGGVSRGHRGFYSFDISVIPSGSTVTSATLRLYQFNFAGSPYAELGNVVVDHLDYGATIGGLEDYSATAFVSGMGPLSTNTTVEYKTLGVTARVQADVAAGRTRSQYRLRFSNADFSNDGSADFVQFSDAEFFTADVPQLVVKYREPAP
ncbi:MAG: hypothetical protein ACREMJ_11510 [Gemmatimonadales bacterium]